MIVVELEDVSLWRGDRHILREVCWTIEAGRHWALLGANGSGKTTLLRVITGYEWPGRGTVRVLGETWGQTDLRVLRRRIGWVSSTLVGQFPPGDTVRDAVLSGIDASIGLYRSFSPAEEEAARAAMQALGIGHLAGQRCSLLSQGELQRVLIARAMIHQPALLILDEPCAGLDPAARLGFLDDLGRLTRGPQSPTILLVTHHLEEIAPWIGYVAVLRDGRMLHQGPKQEVLTSSVMSAALSMPLEVTRNGEYYALHPAQG